MSEKFEKHNDMLFRILEEPVPLTDDAETFMDWWISNVSINKYLGMKEQRDFLREGEETQ